MFSEVRTSLKDDFAGTNFAYQRARPSVLQDHNCELLQRLPGLVPLLSISLHVEEVSKRFVWYAIVLGERVVAALVVFAVDPTESRVALMESDDEQLGGIMRLLLHALFDAVEDSIGYVFAVLKDSAHV